ncbi:hypothetical protein, partial [Salmonella sp. SAL4437]|uniref:hypothetical protein n=1 Tax=Salmonella sp. SAL4437 TaxID=3159892 RepID=UPI00397947C5
MTPLEDNSLFKLPGQYIDTSGEEIFARATFALTANYPGAEVHPASTSNYSTGRSGNAIDKVVIHTAQGSWSGTW